jgi:hypothetical protein
VKVLSLQFGAKITFIHAGNPQPEQKQLLDEYLEKYGFKDGDYKIIFKRGGINKTINEITEAEHIDMVVTGALRREPLRKLYTGSVSRNLARKAKVPVFLIPEAHLPITPTQKIVIAINDEVPRRVIEAGLHFAHNTKGSKVYLVKESVLHGAKFGLSQYYADNEADKSHHELVACEMGYLDEIMQYFDTEGLDIYKKVVSGHSGLAVVEFANKIKADLLIDAFPDFRLGILDRIFPHDVEFALQNLPCKLLLIH